MTEAKIINQFWPWLYWLMSLLGIQSFPVLFLPLRLMSSGPLCWILFLCHSRCVSGLRCSLNGLTPLMSWWLEIIFPAQTFLLSSWSTHMTIASPASLTQYIQIEFISSSPCPTNKSALISVELEVSTLVLLSLWTNPFTHQIL